jgi:hypothetical protein
MLLDSLTVYGKIILSAEEYMYTKEYKAGSLPVYYTNISYPKLSRFLKICLFLC